MKEQKINAAGLAVYDLATCYRDSGDFAESIHYYTDAINLLHEARINFRGCMLYDRAIAYDLYCKPYEATSDFEQALAFFEKFIDVEPNDPAVGNFKILCEQVQDQLRIRKGFDFEATNYLSAISLRRWDQRNLPLKVFIDSTLDSGFNPNFRQKIWEYTSKWSSNELIEIVLTDTEAEAGLVIKRTVDPGQVSLNAGARTVFEPTSSTEIEKAHVYMLCPTSDFDLLGDQQKQMICSVALHEIGHALGLDGHSPFGTDVMYWKSRLLEISSRDWQTLKLLYQ